MSIKIKEGADTEKSGLLPPCVWGLSEKLAQQPEKEAGRDGRTEQFGEDGNQTSHQRNLLLFRLRRSPQENRSVKNTRRVRRGLQGMTSSKRETAAQLPKMQRSLFDRIKGKKMRNSELREDQRLTLKAAMPG